MTYPHATLEITMEIEKKAILEAGIRKQELLVADFVQRISDAMINDGNVNEENYDTQQQTFNAGVLSEINALTHELEFAKEELRNLRKINTETIFHEVAVGAVVRTNQRTFFVSSSLEEFRVNGHTFFGISAHSPIFKAMKGKRAGDRFEISDTEYLIGDVY